MKSELQILYIHACTTLFLLPPPPHLTPFSFSPLSLPPILLIPASPFLLSPSFPSSLPLSLPSSLPPPPPSPPPPSPPLPPPFPPSLPLSLPLLPPSHSPSLPSSLISSLPPPPPSVPSSLPPSLHRYKREFGFTIPSRDIVVDDIRVRGTGKACTNHPQLLSKATEEPKVEMVCMRTRAEL